jgi:alpha-beta hydrolase superfamily lysophospholipase
VILLHGYNSKEPKVGGKELAPLAKYLQEAGCAVLVPDLRGHGESNQVKTAAGLRPIETARLTLPDFRMMCESDMAVWHKFLVQRNDDAELNLDKLCIVGCDLGASVALRYALRDWSWPDLAGKRQGHFVKGLVLISPLFNFHGLDVAEALNSPAIRSQLSTLILVGKKNPAALRDAKGIDNKLKMGALGKTDDDPGPRHFFVDLNTKLQGSQMLGVNDQELNVEARIAKFIDLRLAKKDIPWQLIRQKAAAGP